MLAFACVSFCPQGTSHLPTGDYFRPSTVQRVHTSHPRCDASEPHLLTQSRYWEADQRKPSCHLLVLESDARGQGQSVACRPVVSEGRWTAQPRPFGSKGRLSEGVGRQRGLRGSYVFGVLTERGHEVSRLVCFHKATARPFCRSSHQRGHTQYARVAVKP